MKNSQKYNQSGNNSYDSTPMKDNGTKPHQHGHGLSKREQSNADVDNQNGNNGFGSNVPPFPYFEPGEQQHYGPPGNGKTVAKTLNFFKEITRFRSCFSLMINIFSAVYTRMTPPGTSRPSSVPNAPYHHNNHQNNHQMHGVSILTDTKTLKSNLKKMMKHIDA